MGSGPLVNKKNRGGEGKNIASAGEKKPPATSGVRGSKPVANDPESGTVVAGRVVTGLPLRICTAPPPSRIQQQQKTAMAGKDEAIGDVVHIVVVFGASVSWWAGRKR